jgi:hypothetical protein
MVEKTVKNGMVAVLVSRGYGAGWSTWCYDYDREKLMYDPTLVELVEGNASRENLEYYVRTAYPEQYTGGLDGIYVEWVPQGTRFRVNEYDGAETVEILDLENCEVA